MKIAHLDRVGKVLGPELERSAIWLLCHYPDHPETDVRVQKAYEVHRKWGLPIWLFGSNNAHFSAPVEDLIKKKLVDLGVHPAQVRLSSEFGSAPSLDTVQEMLNVVATAKKEGVTRLVCISNALQLMQVYGLMRDERERFVFMPTKLTDKRWWYVGTRLALIPVAFAGVGPKFIPLRFVRHARGRWKKWGL